MEVSVWLCDTIMEEWGRISVAKANKTCWVKLMCDNCWGNEIPFYCSRLLCIYTTNYKHYLFIYFRLATSQCLSLKKRFIKTNAVKLNNNELQFGSNQQNVQLWKTTLLVSYNYICDLNNKFVNSERQFC